MYKFITHLTSGSLTFATTIYEFKERFQGIMHNKTKKTLSKSDFVHKFEIMIMPLVMSFIRKSITVIWQSYSQ